MKVYLGFASHYDTNFVREKLDKSNLGNTKINIRAIFSQTGSFEEKEEIDKDDGYDFRQLHARRIQVTSD